MKRIFAFLLLFCLLVPLFCACGSAGDGEKKEFTVVATVFPTYDWIREILGEEAGRTDLKLLLDNGVDLHSFQPTAEDMMNISACDLFVYVGGESDAWVEDALKTGANPKRVTVNLMEVLGSAARPEEAVEGMQNDGEEEEEAMDEHVWLSLKNAVVFADALQKALGEMDPAHRETYEKNAAAFTKKCADLDERYESAVRAGRVKTLLVADRFPFLYLVKDYSLSYYAAFSGCAAESEASFETVVFLAKMLKENGLKAVLILKGSDGKIARTVMDSADVKDIPVLTLDSMQTVGIREIGEGATYLKIMEENLAVLETALA